MCHLLTCKSVKWLVSVWQRRDQRMCLYFVTDFLFAFVSTQQVYRCFQSSGRKKHSSFQFELQFPTSPSLLWGWAVNYQITQLSFSNQNKKELITQLRAKIEMIPFWESLFIQPFSQCQHIVPISDQRFQLCGSVRTDSCVMLLCACGFLTLWATDIESEMTENPDSIEWVSVWKSSQYKGRSLPTLGCPHPSPSLQFSFIYWCLNSTSPCTEDIQRQLRSSSFRFNCFFSSP